MNANDRFLRPRRARRRRGRAAVAEFAQDLRRRLAARLRVPMREIAQSDTPASFGAEKNPPIVVYDTSGPYTDPAANIDIRAGLPPLRARWIAERGDTVSSTEPSSAYGRARLADSATAGLRFDLQRKPRRADDSGAMSRRCTTRAAASSRRRWNSSPSARTCSAKSCCGRSRSSSRASIRGQSFGAAIPAVRHAGVRARRSRARPRDHSRQHQPPRNRADDHRPQLPGEDQRQHRQLRRLLVDRGGSRENDLGDPLGRRHGDGPVDRQEHPRDARVDHPQLARADRHGADLPGAGKGRRQGRGADLGDLPRHADRAGRAGRGLLHDPRRRAAALHPADREAHDRHRLARRLDHGQVVPRAPPGIFPLHALRGDLRDHEGLRRRVLPRRRPASRLRLTTPTTRRSWPNSRRWAS